MQVRLSSVIRGPCVNMFIWKDATFVNPAKDKRGKTPPYVWVWKKKLLTGEPDLSSNNTGCIHLLVYPVWQSKRTSKRLRCLKPSSCSVYFPCSSESPEHRGGSVAGEVNLDRRRRWRLTLLAPVRSAIPHTSTAKRDDDLRQPEQEASGERRRREETSRTGEWNKYTEARRQGSLNEMWKRKQDERGKKVKYTESVEAGGQSDRRVNKAADGKGHIRGKMCRVLHTRYLAEKQLIA